MKLGFLDYVRAAFSAKPLGMFVPPNWLGLGIFAILGLINPGLWLLGAGLELGYLYTMASSKRFQNLVRGGFLLTQRMEWMQQIQRLLSQLPTEDQQAYHQLEGRCHAILTQQAQDSTGLEVQGEGFAKLMRIFLRLLMARQTILKVQKESATVSERDRTSLQTRLESLQKQLEDQSLNIELRKSLTSQVEIIQQRLAKQAEAREKLAFLNAELTRIREQVELIREQAALTADPAAVSQRIDEISASLGGTNEWINQQKVFGRTDELLEESVPMPMPQPPQQEQQSQ